MFWSVHPGALRHEVLRLREDGVGASEIARLTGLPRSTVRDIRARPLCPRCWKPVRPMLFAGGDYAELLGLYLGDGYVCQAGRTQRLRISLDSRYAGMNDEIQELVQRCLPGNRVSRVLNDEGRTTVISAYCGHWSCLFPQHGEGKKHERPIRLESWQQAHVAEHPWSFLRGLLRSDGCSFVNVTGRYRYLTYHFSNHSTDILELFESTCLALGLRPRRAGTYVRLNRREDVALLERHVGRKF